MSKAVLQPGGKGKGKRGRGENQNRCILCNEECDEDRSNLSPEAWDRLKDKAEEWKDLRKFGAVYYSVDWEAGPKGTFFHKSCRASLGSHGKLVLIKLSNSTKERRTRLSRHRNLYNTHLVPQAVQVSSTTNTCVCGA